MKDILLAYGLPAQTVGAVMSLYTGTTAHVLTPDGPSDSFGVSAGVLQGDTLAPYIFVLVVDYVMRRAIDEAGEECGFQTQHRR